MAEWNSIGHVPFKEKDQVYTDYRATIDKIFTYLNVDSSQRRLDSFKNNLQWQKSRLRVKISCIMNAKKLVRAYEHLKSEIAILRKQHRLPDFFVEKSEEDWYGKWNVKFEALKDESKLIEQKINLLDEKV